MNNGFFNKGYELRQTDGKTLEISGEMYSYLPYSYLSDDGEFSVIHSQRAICISVWGEYSDTLDLVNNLIRDEK